MPEGGGRTAKIKSFYGSGGPQAVIDMLKWNFDLDIHHYVEADFETFEKVVDAIGTVNVWFDNPTRDEFTGLQIDKPGCQALDGGQALQYVRARHIQELIDGEWKDVGEDAPDIHRIQRQQSFIRKLSALAISKSLSDPITAIAIADSALQYMKLDQGVGRDQVNQLVKSFRTVDVNDPTSVRFETIPVINDPAPSSSLGSTLVLGDGAQAMLDQLRTFGNGAPPASTVVPSQVKVRVVEGFPANETEAGRPQGVAAKLREYGFLAQPGPKPKRGAFVTEIRYPQSMTAEAKYLLATVPDAGATLDKTLTDHIELVLGATFSGIVAPVVPTTVPADASGTTAPSTTTTTVPPPSSTVDPSQAACT